MLTPDDLAAWNAAHDAARAAHEDNLARDARETRAVQVEQRRTARKAERKASADRVTAANLPQHRALVYARDITDTMIRERRMVAAGTVQGQLIATTAVKDQVVLTLLVGDPAVRAFVPVGVGDAVEVWRGER